MTPSIKLLICNKDKESLNFYKQTKITTVKLFHYINFLGLEKKYRFNTVTIFRIRSSPGNLLLFSKFLYFIDRISKYASIMILYGIVIVVILGCLFCSPYNSQLITGMLSFSTVNPSSLLFYSRVPNNRFPRLLIFRFFSTQDIVSFV